MRVSCHVQRVRPERGVQLDRYKTAGKGGMRYWNVELRIPAFWITVSYLL